MNKEEKQPNAAQLYRTELAGETTVDNSTNAAPAPTE